MAATDKPRALEPGEDVGKYRLEERLGAGGCGEVFTAYHVDTLDTVAVKVLHPEHATEQGLVERFLAEARAARGIDHPGIARVFESGEVNGLPFLVMELLEGEPLQDRVARGVVPIDDALDIAAQAARALHAAHRTGVIHRDVKPDNLFLVASEDGPLVKVLDFGIAKLLDASLRAGVQTKTGFILGTPHYMSPEQCLMRKDIDARADVYSLGVVLFQMLTAELPFDTESLAGLIMAHMTDSPRKPSELNPQLTDAIDSTVLQTLAKEPGHRFADMAELAQVLEGLRKDPSDSKSLRTSIAEGATVMVAAPRPAPVPDDDAVVIAAYRVGERLGSGPISDVFAAEHVRGLRSGAIKLLKPEAMASRSRVTSYLEQARESMGLSSEHICEVFDVGEKDGQAYVLMQRVMGLPLEQFLGPGRAMPEPDVTHIGQGLTSALAEAHDRGFVHGCLSPTNVLLWRDEHGVVQPMLTDFGVHHLRAGGALLPSQQRYSSPEQVAGTVQLHPSMDVFSLAVLLYELLVGEPPFDDDAPAPRQTRTSMVQRVAVPPRSRVRHVSAGMEGVLLKALRPKRRDRFANMAEFGDALKYVASRHAEVARRVDQAMGASISMTPRSSEERTRAIAEKLQGMVTAKLEAGDLTLPAMPATVNQAIGMLDNPRTAIREVSLLLDKDPVLASQVLKVANSPIFMGSGKAATINHAVTRLGAANLRAILVECSAHQLFQSRVASIRREMEAIWSHSVVVASVARELVRVKFGPDPALTYMAGLLHDVGKPIVGGILLDLEKELAQKDRKFMDHDMWVRVVSASHREVGGSVVKAWNIHELIQDGIQHCADYDMDEPGRLSNYVCFANNIAKRERPHSGSSSEEQVADAIARGSELFGLSEADLSRFVDVAQAA